MAEYPLMKYWEAPDGTVYEVCDEEARSKGIDEEQLAEAVNTALAQAKETGEFDGAPGPQGPQGEKGDTGATGPQGPKGDTGPAGSNATVTEDSIKNALGYTPADAETVSQLSAEIGNIDAALDGIIALQNSYIGGDGT